MQHLHSSSGNPQLGFHKLISSIHRNQKPLYGNQYNSRKLQKNTWLYCYFFLSIELSCELQDAVLGFVDRACHDLRQSTARSAVLLPSTAPTAIRQGRSLTLRTISSTHGSQSTAKVKHKKRWININIEFLFVRALPW